MANMFLRYAEYKKYDPDKTNDFADFTVSYIIAPYALGAMK